MVDRVWLSDGVWWVDYTTTFPYTGRAGYGLARLDLFVARRTRVR